MVRLSSPFRIHPKSDTKLLARGWMEVLILDVYWAISDGGELTTGIKLEPSHFGTRTKEHQLGGAWSEDDFYWNFHCSLSERKTLDHPWETLAASHPHQQQLKALVFIFVPALYPFILGHFPRIPFHRHGNVTMTVSDTWIISDSLRNSEIKFQSDWKKENKSSVTLIPSGIVPALSISL